MFALHPKNAFAKLRLTLPPGTLCLLCHNLVAHLRRVDSGRVLTVGRAEDNMVR